MTQTSTGASPQNFAAPSKPTKSAPHYRMTVEMAREAFDDGLITTKGYIYFLIKSSRKDGHKFRIKNVKAFCKEHGLSKSAYYRAIAELKASGRISFETQDHMDLWIPENIIYLEERKNDPQVGQVSQQRVQQAQDWERESHLWDPEDQEWENQSTEASSIKALSDPSDLLQLPFRSSTEKERKKEREIVSENDQETLGSISQKVDPDQEDPNQIPDQSQNSQQNLVEKVITTEWDQFSAPGAEPDFFDFVVRRTAKFPKPPADPHCAAEAWIRKQGHVLYPQFLEWLEGQKQAAARLASPPVATEPPPATELEKMTPLMWLERYRHMWQAGPQIRKQIHRAIFEHPERGLQIGKDGPELLALA